MATARTIHRHGCTAIERDDQHTVVLHMGARDHQERTHVRPAVDAIFGRGVFDRIRRFAVWEHDRSGMPQQHPDAMYAFRLPNDLFDNLVG